MFRLLFYYDTPYYGPFMVVELICMFLILLIFFGLFLENHFFQEKRLLVLFIYFELIFLFLAVLVLLMVFLRTNENRGMYLTCALLLIGASGTETAIFLALFMRYFRLTGLITFLVDRKISKKVVRKPMYRVKRFFN